jgi:hypothetical protein
LAKNWQGFELVRGLGCSEACLVVAHLFLT